MSNNPYLKPLKAFNPENLAVDESFTGIIKEKTGPFSEPLTDDTILRITPGAVKEFSSLKTGGAIHSGCIELFKSADREIFAAANIKGEIYYFEQGRNGIQAVSKVSLQGAIYTTPAYSGGVLYCTTRDGIVYAVDTGLGLESAAQDGVKNRVLWRKKMKKGIFAEPVLVDKLLLVTTLEGIFAFDINNTDEKNSGAAQWGVSINGTLSTPAVDSGMIFIGSEDKRFFGFDYSGGSPKKIWDNNLGGVCRMRPFILKTRDYAVAATVNGFVYAVDKRSGENKWSFAVKSPVIGNITSAIISGVEHLFFGSDESVFYCIDPSGKKVWDFKAEGKIRSEPVIAGGLVCFGSEDNSLYGLDMVTGKEVFRHKTGGNIYGRPLPSGNRIYFGSTDGYIYSAGM